ncbi:hypothetical protein [Streptomyces microflavus]|uniref:hypothetical protein n=1 Tax=Streptomyces microflavus TaxID=1919 RepID=UPI00363DA635
MPNARQDRQAVPWGPITATKHQRHRPPRFQQARQHDALVPQRPAGQQQVRLLSTDRKQQIHPGRGVHPLAGDGTRAPGK